MKFCRAGNFCVKLFPQAAFVDARDYGQNALGITKENHLKRLGKNHGGYHGETIDIRAVLRVVASAAQKHGWTSEIFHEQGEFKWLALHRAPLSTLNSQPSTRLYISAG